MLAPSDPPAFTLRRGASTRYVLVCDHASAEVPAVLGSLGLAPEAFGRHIAIDIGARWVAERVADRLDATLLAAGYSRLVIDCNRYPWDPGSMTPESDRTAVPANQGLDERARLARVRSIFLPYQRAISATLDALLASGERPALLSIHSCTPELGGRRRPWEIGFSYTPPATLARACLDALSADRSLSIGDNEPYAMDLGMDYTTPEQGLRRGLHCIQVEFRQDLIATESGARHWADRFTDALLSVSDAVLAQAATRWQPAWPCPHAGPDGPELLHKPQSQRAVGT